MATASERIPHAVRPLVSERARKTLDLVILTSFNDVERLDNLTAEGREIRQRRMSSCRPRLQCPAWSGRGPLEPPSHYGGPEG